MKTRHMVPVLIGALVLLAVTFQAPLTAQARSCSPPPFISLGGSDTTQNNLLFILDNSGSMNQFAYRENDSGYLAVTATSVQSTVVSWNGTCTSLPACGAIIKQSNCKSSINCTDEFTWSLGGNSGNCQYKYQCSWSGGKCIRIKSSGYPKCTRTSGSDTMTYSCDDSGNCTVTVSDYTSANQTAYWGFKPESKYYGLFKSDKLYKYDNVNHFFYTQDGDGWTGVGTGNLAACVKNGECPGSDKFSGNFLNWLTSRRLDVAKKVLTGGRLGGDTAYWTLVGTPPEREWAKLFNDDGSNGYYYTPFHTGLGIIFDGTDSVKRTPLATGDPKQGDFVPLMTFFEVTFSSGGSRGTTANPARILSLESAFDNPGEDMTGRDYAGSYYFAVKAGTVGTDDPPQGVVQKFAEQMRMGYMRFNYGTGPAESTDNNGDGDFNDLGEQEHKLGATGEYYDIDGNGVKDIVEPKADGGRVINRIGDDSMVDSMQRENGSATGDRLQLSSIVMNINETLNAMNTPLAEVLREAMNYFRQDEPSYAWAQDTNGDGVGDVLRQNFLRRGVDAPEDEPEWDPYYYDGALQPCTNSYIIFVSDGEPTSDTPYKSGCKTLNSGYCSRNDTADIDETFRFDASGYLDDIAFKIHTKDMRPTLGDTLTKELQTIDLYTIYAFGNSDTTRNTLEAAALQGGFVDKPFTAGKDGLAGYQAANLSSDWRNIYPCAPGDTTNCRTDGYTGYIEWDSNADATVDHFFVASNDESFGEEVEKFITQVITHLVARGSAAAVATISQETSDGDVIVRGAFTAADPDDDSRAVWHGHLEAYWPTDATSVGSEENVYEFDFPHNEGVFCGELAQTHNSKLGQPAPSCWDAADFLSRSKRSTLQKGEIFTVTDGVQTNFHIDNIDDGTGNASALRRLMRSYPEGLPSSAEAKAAIEWVRGEVNDAGQPADGTAAGKTYRNRKGSRLGDIVYSTPVVVGPPSLANVPRADPNYTEFLVYRQYHSTVPSPAAAPYNKRPKIAYVGANDGMLHAFLMAVWDTTNKRWDYKCTGYPYIDLDSTRDTRSTVDCGDHLWAFIPSNAVGELMYLCDTDYGGTSGDACMHRTMVDLSPKAYDVYIDPDGSGSEARQWRTVIVGGQRGGGDTYFAIDVTEPGKPNVLWQYSALENLPVVYTDSGVEKMVLPFKKRYVAQDIDTDGDTDYFQDDVHFNLKSLAMSWSYAAVGRVKFPSSTSDVALGNHDPDFGFYHYNDPGASQASFVYPDASGKAPADPTLAKVKFPADPAADKYANLRHIAFIGSGFRLFDTASITAPFPDNTTIRKALQKPYVMAIDIETGINYFQVLWPILVKARSDASLLPEEPITIGTVTKNIPWALGDPTIVDVWDDKKVRYGEDGFVDHLYVGDMRGYLYKMRFEFSGGSTVTKGVAVDFWKTKFIPKGGASAPITSLTQCDNEANYFRGCRQPITVAPTVSVDSSTVYSKHPSLRIMFGTGKFDDVISAGYDDLTDKIKMSFYNAEDVITAGPDLTSSVVCSVAARTGTNTYEKIDFGSTGSGKELGFKITGTNVGIKYGTDPHVTGVAGASFCGDVGTLTEEDEKYCQFGCPPTAAVDCDDNQKKEICDGLTNPDDVTKCKEECQVITRSSDCCSWVRDCPKDTTTCTKGHVPDSCEGDCDNGTHFLSASDTPCWKCVFDFSSESERVIGKAAVLGGYVFFTTYIPSKKTTTTGCSTTSAGVGSGYLYVFDYRCRAFTSNPLTTLGSEGGSGYLVTAGNGGGASQFYGGRIGLGEGMPSQPVLDSKGESVIVQKSDAALVRIEVDPLGGGNADGDVAGWTER
ncbi:MAG: hypothetical protein V1792_01025 [Pseudomonadota bacterium]